MTVKMNGVFLACEETDEHIIIKKNDLIKQWIENNGNRASRVVNSTKSCAYSYSDEKGDIHNNGDGNCWLETKLRIHIKFDVAEVTE